jgi:hypothetical protein
MQNVMKASCGHLVSTNERVSMSNAYISKNGKRSVRYATYCKECAKQVRKNGEVLNDSNAERHWLFDGFTA